MRAVVYTRVSSDPNGQGRSVQSQEAECRATCERNNWEILEVLTDNDRGASRHSRKKRPAYARLSELLGKDTVLVAWEASRLQRDLTAYTELRDLCATKGAHWCLNGRLYDLNNGDDRFHTGLNVLVAEKEADSIRDRVLRGKRHAAEAGRPATRLPYGYRRLFDPQTGLTSGWTICEETGPVVTKLVADIIAGHSLRSLASDLNDRGVPPPAGQKNAAKRWDPRTIRQMLRSPSYAGLRQHDKQIVGTGDWPALITPEDHELLVGVLDDPARKVGAPRGPGPHHLLSGIARCGRCGHTMRHDAAGGRRPKYVCDSGKSCVGRRSDLVDEYIVEVVVGRLSMPDAAAAFTPADNTGEREQARRQAQLLQTRLDGFIEAAADGTVTPAALADIEKRLRPQIEAARKAARPPVESPVLQQFTGTTDVRGVWDGLAVIDRRALVRILLGVTILPNSEKCTRDFNHDDIQIDWKPGK